MPPAQGPVLVHGHMPPLLRNTRLKCNINYAAPVEFDFTEHINDDGLMMAKRCPANRSASSNMLFGCLLQKKTGVSISRR